VRDLKWFRLEAVRAENVPALPDYPDLKVPKCIKKFAKLMRAILLHSRETSIPLKEEVEMLENYLSIEQFSRPNKFEYQIKVAEELDVDELMIPPMMIQPFVENAVKHGINYLKHGGKIEIAFSKKDDKLVCSIIDNGIGRAASTQINAQKAKNHKSTALAVTKERLDILNNENNDYKSLEIKDLINTDGSAAGTEVLVRMPFEEWYEYRQPQANQQSR